MNRLAVCVQNSDQQVTAKETIDAIYKAGFKNVFVQYYHQDTKGLSELEQIDYCKRLGLNIVFCHLGYKGERPINELWVEGKKGDELIDRYIEDFKVMKEKEIDLVVIHLMSGRNIPMYSKIGLKRIEKLAKAAKELNIRIAFENTKKPGYLEYVLSNVKADNIGLCYDAGHCHCHFKDEFDYEFFKDKIFALHLHDNDMSDDLHLLPFDGTIDWKYVMSKLKESGYDEPITLELCYRHQYLNQTIEEFYKEGYERGLRLEEIYDKVR